MGYWSSNWDKPWRDIKRFGEDVYNRANSWYGRNQKYLPNNRTAGGFVGFGRGISSGIKWGADQAGKAYNRAWDNSHGDDRYWLSQVPLLGWAKQMQDKANYYEDYYKHTGVDPKYSQTYSRSSGGLLGSLAGETASSTPSRWARSVEQLFPVKFEENLSRTEAFNKGYW